MTRLYEIRTKDGDSITINLDAIHVLTIPSRLNPQAPPNAQLFIGPMKVDLSIEDAEKIRQALVVR